MYIYPLSLVSSSHIPPNPNPSRSSQSNWAELPVLYSSFPLAIYFTHGSVYMSFWVEVSWEAPAADWRWQRSVLSSPGFLQWATFILGLPTGSARVCQICITVSSSFVQSCFSVPFLESQLSTMVWRLCLPNPASCLTFHEHPPPLPISYNALWTLSQHLLSERPKLAHKIVNE